MADEPLDPTVAELLFRDAMEEVGRVAFLAEDYTQRLFDATERRDLMAIAVRLQQLRFCTIAMIQTFNHFLRGKAHDQGVAEAAGPSDAHREDQRSGDVVA